MKEELRKKYIKLRKDILDRKEKENKIFNSIISLDNYIKAQTIGLYCANMYEVNLDYLIEYSLKNNKRIGIPTVIDNHNMKFNEIKSLDEINNINIYSIREALNNNIINPNMFDLIIVPGICFDKYKNRIGYGKGYYDNYLRNLSCFKVGVCFYEQVVNKIDSDSFDIQLDNIITDKILIR